MGKVACARIRLARARSFCAHGIMRNDRPRGLAYQPECLSRFVDLLAGAEWRRWDDVILDHPQTLKWLRRRESDRKWSRGLLHQIPSLRSDPGNFRRRWNVFICSG